MEKLSWSDNHDHHDYAIVSIVSKGVAEGKYQTFCQTRIGILPKIPIGQNGWFLHSATKASFLKLVFLFVIFHFIKIADLKMLNQNKKARQRSNLPPKYDTALILH